MRCAKCEFENPEGAHFCEECGAKLFQGCPSCGYEVRPTARFCGQCGAALTESLRPPAPSRSPLRTVTPAQASPFLATPGASEAERRQLTVMFCDLVGSTALAEQLDPEELREIVRTYQAACAEVIHRFDGHIAQYLGDGLLVYFGYPHAHEDDAQRAVRAGLGIVAALRAPALFQSLRLPSPIQVRIGIHTGVVVIGEIGAEGRREQLALGDTPNIAARLQAIAEPDTVVISAATYRLIEGYFECQDMGTHALKGLSTSTQAYRILGESGVQDRFEVAIKKGLILLVGREAEIGLLQTCWEQAKEGKGQVALLSGEAGIGKSRLIQEMKERAARDSITKIECYCSPYHQYSALYPVIAHLQRLLPFRREDTPQEKLRTLEAVLKRYAFAQPESLPLLAGLLSLPLPEHWTLPNWTPQRQKQKTLETVLSWLLEEAERQPVLFVMEDLQWSDPSTLELLGLTIEQVPTTRMLILLTFRPEFSPPWPARSYITHIALSRLVRKYIEEMVREITGGKTLPPNVTQQILTKTDGIPLFIEELTKTVLESGLLREQDTYYELTGPLPPLAIPATLHDSLMARLDRLATVREIAQLAATLGREFSYELIQAVSLLDEESLQRELNRLVEAELLYQRGLPPQARYLFKHALIQETAYHSLLKSKKQQYHQRIALALEQQFPETSTAHPELVAHHYTEAGLGEHALSYWQRAGQKAIERSAHAEAISHLTKGLELLKTFSDALAHMHQELLFCTTLGPALMATKGYAAPEVEEVYTRARALCSQIGETPELFPALLGLSTFYLIRGDFHTAHELGEQLLSLAQREQDSALLVEAHYILGTTLFHLGELLSARTHLEEGIALYDSRQHRFLAFRYGQDPGVFCLCYMVRILWFLGYPDQALKRSHEALALAQEISHPFSSAVARTFAALVFQLRREGYAAQEQAETVMTLCAEHGFAFYLAMGTILRGWALAEQGEREEGIAQLGQGLTAWQATGAELFRPHLLALLAEAYGKAGQAEEGLRVLDEALGAAHKSGKRFYEAELYRLRGQLTLEARDWRRETGNWSLIPAPQASNLKPPVSSEVEQEAEGYFLKAIEIARQQQAKSWELRAVSSLARLWQHQGKRTAARQMLAEIYGWFTEGFDTKDLQEAKMLLGELA